MMWAACCLCYFGFLRAGEITVSCEAEYDRGVHLNFSDVAVDSISNPTTLRVTRHQTQTHSDWEYTYSWDKHQAKRGRQEGMLFKFEDGKLLTRELFVSQVRAALTAA